jgi:membrane-bound lytic murein transglycosylase B
MQIKIFYSIVLLLGIGSGVYADNALLRQKDVQLFINNMVVHDGFSRGELVAAMKAAQFQPQIIESMDKPYEKKTWDVYKALFVTPARVQQGIDFWQANAETLSRAQKEYGVPADIIVAILGVETQYGKRQGEYRVLDALTTLAFHYPKRSDYFTKELREFFLLCQEHHVSPTTYIGSYAGAIGQPQFMPSSYRQFAVDFDGHGKRDLINNNKDVIGSVANYFHQHGWMPHEYVVQQAKLEGDRTKPLAVNSKHADYAYTELVASGVKLMSTIPNHPKQAGLIELTTDKGSEYWVAYPNFYVITRYNTSPQYALAVYLLSQQLLQKRAEIMTKNLHAYA